MVELSFETTKDILCRYAIAEDVMGSLDVERFLNLSIGRDVEMEEDQGREYERRRLPCLQPHDCKKPTPVMRNR